MEEMICPVCGQYIDVSEFYKQGRADAIDEIESNVAEWHGLSQDGLIPCQKVIDLCEEIGVE